MKNIKGEAELSYNNDGAQFIKCFERELFTGKFKKIATWFAFALLGFSVIVNVSGDVRSAGGKGITGGYEKGSRINCGRYWD